MALMIPYSWRFPHENPAAVCERAGNCPLVTHIQQKAAQLAKFQEQLLQKQKKLDQRQQELERWSQRLHRRQQNLEEQARSAVREQKAQLDETLLVLAQQKQLQDQRQTQLDRREAQLREKASNLRRQADVELEEQVRIVRGDFMALNQEMKLAREHLVALSGCIDQGNRSAVEQLCKLYRTMVFSREPAVLEQARQLAVILQTEFGAEALSPRTGDVYDSMLHERLDTTRAGGRISRCLATGWRWKDEVILRAVVDTEEGSAFV